MSQGGTMKDLLRSHFTPAKTKCQEDATEVVITDVRINLGSAIRIMFIFGLASMITGTVLGVVIWVVIGAILEWRAYPW